jgi:hypothetical protein
MISRIFLLAAIFTGSGCGKSPIPCPVSGQVIVNKRPAEGAYVILHPVGMKDGQQGSFTMTVQRPGEYVMTVFWPKVITQASESFEGEDQLQGQYSDPQRPVQTVTIQTGANALKPIELKSP